MDLPRLLELSRVELDDIIEPYFWSDEDLVRHLNEAVRQAAVRARLLVESQLPMCTIALEAGEALYELDRAIIVVRRAVLASRPSEPLARTTTAALDRSSTTWLADTGSPRAIVVDQQGAGRVLRVTPVPTAADTLQLTVLRYPTVEEQLSVGDDGAEPPISEEHHEALIHWVCHRAFRIPDQELQDVARANDHYGQFEAHFGPMPTAAQLQELAIDRTSGTEPVWF